jgi:ATP-dependent Clp protease ATP-binding subunit ClpA
MKRAITNVIMNQLSVKLLNDNLKVGDSVVLDVDKDGSLLIQ